VGGRTARAMELKTSLGPFGKLGDSAGGLPDEVRTILIGPVFFPGFAPTLRQRRIIPLPVMGPKVG